MPNWCSIECVMVGEENTINTIYNDLENLQKDGRLSNGFGNLWLGNIVDLYGGDWNKVYCRGEIQDYQKCDGVSKIRLSIENAWGVCTEVFDLIEQHFNTEDEIKVEIFYKGDECGMNIHVTNDTEGDYFPAKYYLEYYLPDDGFLMVETFEDFDELKDFIANLTDGTEIKSVEDIADINEVWKLKDEDSYISCSEYEIIF